MSNEIDIDLRAVMIFLFLMAMFVILIGGHTTGEHMNEATKYTGIIQNKTMIKVSHGFDTYWEYYIIIDNYKVEVSKYDYLNYNIGDKIDYRINHEIGDLYLESEVQEWNKEHENNSFLQGGELWE